VLILATMHDTIYCGDNLEVLPKYIPDDSVDLVYIDPPFNTSRNYEVFWGEAQERRAFDDRFGDITVYMDWMRPRLRELHRILKPTGSFYYHCDPHASHYIKVELDRIFGFDNFRNEIIWRRTSVHSGARRFGSVHDTIFFYSKGKKYTWNPTLEPMSALTAQQWYNNIEPKTQRRFNRADLTAPGSTGGASSAIWRGIDPSTKGRHWAIPGFLSSIVAGKNTTDALDALDAAGRIHWPKRSGGMPMLKRYIEESPGIPAQDVITDISPLKNNAPERLGYPTQKPLALLERLINASSNEGDTILDAFCGCGTALEAASTLKRKWLGIDFSPTACRVMSERLEKLGLRVGVDFYLRDMPKSPEVLRKMPPFEFENWAVVALGGIPNKVKVGDYGIDGRLYLADIGKTHRGDFMETLDLWYPIQVKQMDHVGRPDIDKFETAMRRDKRLKGYFVAFGYTRDALSEVRRANNDGLDIVPITVGEILEHERVAV
jgi:DNA modification methylase